MTLARKMKIRTLGQTYKKLGKRLAYELKNEEGKKLASIGILQLKDLAPGSLAGKKEKKVEEDPFNALRRN